VCILFHTAICGLGLGLEHFGLVLLGLGLDTDGLGLGTAGLDYKSGTDLGTIPGLCAKVRSSEFWRVCYRINTLGSQLSPSSVNLAPAQAGKATVGLASHWPCVTDTVVYPPTGSTANDKEMSTHAYAPLGRGTIYLTLQYIHKHYLNNNLSFNCSTITTYSVCMH